MVAVVVPSPAMSLVFCATALTSLAPMFSNGSGSSISLDTVTPSLVTVGPPKLFSMMTLRPVGPSVLPTALASFSAPAKSFLRASSVYSSCFAMIYISPSSVLRGPVAVPRIFGHNKRGKLKGDRHVHRGRHSGSGQAATLYSCPNPD